MTKPLRSLSPASLAALRDGGSLDAGEAARVIEALRRRPGQRSWKTVAADEARFAKIKSIGKTFWPSTNTSECARQFYLALSRYHGGRWQRDRLCAECPTNLSPLHQQFWGLLKLHDRLLSEDRLRRILGRELRAIHDQHKGSS